MYISLFASTVYPSDRLKVSVQHVQSYQPSNLLRLFFFCTCSEYTGADPNSFLACAIYRQVQHHTYQNSPSASIYRLLLRHTRTAGEPWGVARFQVPRKQRYRCDVKHACCEGVDTPFFGFRNLFTVLNKRVVKRDCSEFQNDRTSFFCAR